MMQHFITEGYGEPPDWWLGGGKTSYSSEIHQKSHYNPAETPERETKTAPPTDAAGSAEPTATLTAEGCKGGFKGCQEQAG